MSTENSTQERAEAPGDRATPLGEFPLVAPKLCVPVPWLWAVAGTIHCLDDSALSGWSSNYENRHMLPGLVRP